MSATDTKSRNFLHLAILSGVNLHELGIEVFQVWESASESSYLIEGV